MLVESTTRASAAKIGPVSGMCLTDNSSELGEVEKMVGPFREANVHIRGMCNRIQALINRLEGMPEKKDSAHGEPDVKPDGIIGYLRDCAEESSYSRNKMQD